MKNLLNTIAIALISLFIFTSCDKADDIPMEKKEREISNTQMQNPKNPYDKEGEQHNAFLDYFIAKADGSKEMNREKMLKIYADFYASQKMEFGDEQIAGYGELFDAYSEMNIGVPSSNFPPQFCRWFPVICDILTPSPTFPYPLPLGLLNEDNGGTSTDRTLTFIDAVKENEAKILADKELSEEQQKALLNQHAIARYSSGYWHNVSAIQQGKSGYYEAFQEAHAAKVCHTCDVVGADAAGAAVGALVGGVGAGPGAGIASGAALLEKAWNWFWN
ncbi:hypothetical protein SAMN05421747_115100 [Parapedobacter composti]|uniref:Uncharacterized protein n=1 Tax=Parapedobacter composti TaxID=623281 RepID=A0A1I1KDY4_9SPHI|nr:hypothetical protein [Parapedobacter composti]SFC59007.1 hypothetical protein SAMN05421747_115100 [Parapedobacter composti]